MSNDIRLRPPRPQEYSACRMLLSREARRGPAGQYLLAVQDERPYILGAAVYSHNTRVTHSIRLHVIPAYRRRGIGSLLLRRIVGIARETGNETLAATADSVNEPDAGPFLSRCGFRLAGRMTTVETELETAKAALLPLADRILVRERKPANRRIVRLADAPRNAVTALYLAELARNPGTTPWGLLDEVSTPRFADSPVYLSDDRVAGFMLFSVEGDVCVIPARIVAREFQGGPVNLLLMAHALRRSGEYTATRVQFDIPENNRDTESLARRLGARIVRTRDSYFNTSLNSDFDVNPQSQAMPAHPSTGLLISPRQVLAPHRHSWGS